MEHLSARFYTHTLTALLIRPGTFFSTRFEQISSRQAIGILAVSGLLFSTTGTLLAPGTATLTMGAILFINAVGMVGIATGIGYLAVVAATGLRYPFAPLWNVFSLSSGAVLLLAWIPSAFIFTEPWKWWLIGTGLVNALGMTRARAVITVLLTFGATVMVIYSMIPLVNLTRGLLS
jgi:hypothetical protein